MRKGRELAVALWYSDWMLRLIRALWPIWFALSITLGPFWVVLALVAVGFLSCNSRDRRRVVVRGPQRALE